jgi:regulatory protein
MKIQKFVKDNGNKYKVYVDDEVYKLYDDIIVKYGLTMKSSISKEELDKVLEENDKLSSYYESIKYISRKMRSTKEIKEYLRNKDISEDVINETVNKLKENNFLNDDLYLKAYVTDRLNLSNDGPNKIKKNLIKLGIFENKINEYLSNIDEEIYIDRIKSYADKKIKVNHTNSGIMLKAKLQQDLVNLGYDRSMVISIPSSYSINDQDAYNKELDKITKRLSKKYEGKELEYKIKEAMYRKGFKKGDFYEE